MLGKKQFIFYTIFLLYQYLILLLVLYVPISYSTTLKVLGTASNWPAYMLILKRNSVSSVSETLKPDHLIGLDLGRLPWQRWKTGANRLLDNQFRVTKPSNSALLSGLGALWDVLDTVRYWSGPCQVRWLEYMAVESNSNQNSSNNYSPYWACLVMLEPWTWVGVKGKCFDADRGTGNLLFYTLFDVIWQPNYMNSMRWK